MNCVTRPAGHDSVASGSHRSAIPPAPYSTNISGNSFDARTVL
ncbi:terminase large subunit [Escherichia coli P12b]|nr:terminase large subunit [Escherichia coli P12b]